jgi:hypothetical protein
MPDLAARGFPDEKTDTCFAHLTQRPLRPFAQPLELKSARSHVLNRVHYS